MDVNHLPLNEEIVRAILNNPEVTYNDLEALYWSITNSAAMGGWASPLLNVINDKFEELL